MTIDKDMLLKKYMKPVGLSIIGLLVVIVTIILLSPGRIFAGGQVTTTSDDQVGLEITVYNDGTGLVKDTRDIVLPGGEVDLKFMDVASSIDPTSVRFISNTNANSVEVLDQNYEYDLVDVNVLYQKHIDKPISVKTSDGRVIDGTLLSYSGSLVILTDEGVKIVQNPVDVKFEDLPDGLLTRPTLRWTLDVKREGRNECEMSYLTSGMSWTANYVAVVGENDDVLDLSGWVTINNTSGASYNDAMLKLVAGTIHRVPPEMQEMEQLRSLGYLSALKGSGGFTEESFFEYHLYTLQRPATVLNNEQKQISLLEGEGIGVEKILIFSPSGTTYDAYATSEAKIQIKLKFMNEERNGLGIPLPKGVLRVYKEDSSGSLQFIGEDRIDHTPKDEEIEIYLGEAFDIVGEWSLKNTREISPHVQEYDYEVTVRNHKDEAVEVLYWGGVSGDWEVTQSSLEWTQKDASTLEFKLPVEADGETVLSYTIRVKY